MTCSAPRVVRRRRADGATLVEMAIVGLLVFTLLLGVFEFGLLFRDNLTVSDAVGDATRAGAVAGPDVTSDGATGDYEIVRALRQGLASFDLSSVETIAIFRAAGGGDDPESQVPLACRVGNSVNGICNVYVPAVAFAAVENGNYDHFTCDVEGEISCHWDPTERKDGPLPSDVETLGVYVRISKAGYTGLFADSWTITRAAVARLEPGVTEP